MGSWRREGGHGRHIRLVLMLRLDGAADSGVVEQEVHDAAEFFHRVGGEGVLHEAGGEHQFAR